MISQKIIDLQDTISAIRNLMQSYYKKADQISSVENIIHQVRTLSCLTLTYANASDYDNLYKEGIIGRMTIDFLDADNLEKTCEINKKGILIPSYSLIPETILEKNKRYSIFFELLYYKGQYLEFILFEMGPDNITIYNTIKTIISLSIYKFLSADQKNDIDKKDKLLSKKIINNNISNTDNAACNTYQNFNTYKILEYLSDNVNVTTDLNKFAFDLNVSVTSLMRKTKKLTGYSIQKFHEKLKIEKAKILLENKNLTISEISDILGYQNQFYFSSVFKKNTGISPKKWIELKTDK